MDINRENSTIQSRIIDNIIMTNSYDIIGPNSITQNSGSSRDNLHKHSLFLSLFPLNKSQEFSLFNY
jgi:hypothetical protein